MVYCQLKAKEHISMIFYLKFNRFHSRNCTWKCRLQKWRLSCIGLNVTIHILVTFVAKLGTYRDITSVLFVLSLHCFRNYPRVWITDVTGVVEWLEWMLLQFNGYRYRCLGLLHTGNQWVTGWEAGRWQVVETSWETGPATWCADHQCHTAMLFNTNAGSPLASMYLIHRNNYSFTDSAIMVVPTRGPHPLNRRNFTRNKPIQKWGPGDAYMRQVTWSSMVQVMACRLLGDKPIPEPMMTYYQ